MCRTATRALPACLRRQARRSTRGRFSSRSLSSRKPRLRRSGRLTRTTCTTASCRSWAGSSSPRARRCSLTTAESTLSSRSTLLSRQSLLRSQRKAQLRAIRRSTSVGCSTIRPTCRLRPGPRTFRFSSRAPRRPRRRCSSRTGRSRTSASVVLMKSSRTFSAARSRRACSRRRSSPASASST
eukprot:Amastigsp_a842539_18.p4 type:complete len:183 gc:universal Amastigsp_a842539_18:2071-1523(-)